MTTNQAPANQLRISIHVATATVPVQYDISMTVSEFRSWSAAVLVDPNETLTIEADNRIMAIPVRHIITISAEPKLGQRLPR